MDRQIVYPAQIPLDSDQLNAQRNAYVGLGQLAAMTFGWTTVAAGGFACTPGTGLTVSIAPGSLLAPGVVDASTYGTLAAVSSALTHQYVSRDPVTLDVPGVGATYTVYVTPATVDADDTVLPFYNASDPSVTYAGANNTGKTAPTVRQDVAQMGIGTSVPTDAYPLWSIVVPSGATAITSDMIAVASGAPFYPSLAEIGPRIIAPFNAQLATAIGGYPLNAIVSGSVAGTYYISTADNNTPTPGASGASWQSLFNGLALSSDLAAETTRAKTAESALSTSKQDALGFTPIEQGGGTNQTTDKVMIGNISGGTAVLSYTIKGTDCGPIVSGAYGAVTSSGDEYAYGLHWSSGRPLIGYGASISGVTWSAIALYSDVESVQNNLSDAVSSQANTNSSLEGNFDNYLPLSCSGKTLTYGSGANIYQRFQSDGNWVVANGDSTMFSVGGPSGDINCAIEVNFGGEVQGNVSSGTISNGWYSRINSVLRQDFSIVTSAATTTITFPIAYSSPPVVTAIMQNSSGQGGVSAWLNTISITEEAVTFWTRSASGGTDYDAWGPIQIMVCGEQ